MTSRVGCAAEALDIEVIRWPTQFGPTVQQVVDQWIDAEVLDVVVDAQIKRRVEKGRRTKAHLPTDG